MLASDSANSINLRNKPKQRAAATRIIIVNVIAALIILVGFFASNQANVTYIFIGTFSISLVLTGILHNIYRNHYKETSSLLLSNSTIEIPRGFNPNRLKKINLNSITEIQRRGNEKNGLLIISVNNGFNFALPYSFFVSKGDIDFLFNTIRSSIIEHQKSQPTLEQREAQNDTYVKYLPIASFATAIVLVIFFIIQVWVRNIHGYDADLLLLGGLVPQLLLSGEIFRATAAIFLHVDFIHLFVNLALFVTLGNLIEHILKPLNFLCLFLFAGLCGSIASLFFGNFGIAVGSSGAIFGLLGAYTFIRFTYRENLSASVQLLPGWILIPMLMFYILHGFFYPNIDAWGHLGGFVGGLLFTMLLHSQLKPDVATGLSTSPKPVKVMLVLLGSFYLVNVIQVVRINTGSSADSYVFDTLESLDLNVGNRHMYSLTNHLAYTAAANLAPDQSQLSMMIPKMETVVDNSKSNPSYMDTLALLYYQAGHYQEAVEMERAAMQYDDSQPYADRLAMFEKSLNK